MYIFLTRFIVLINIYDETILKFFFVIMKERKTKLLDVIRIFLRNMKSKEKILYIVSWSSEFVERNFSKASDERLNASSQPLKQNNN